MYTSSATSISLVLERLAATVFSSSYEHCGIWFGILLAILQFIFSSFFLSSLYSKNVHTNNCYCQVLSFVEGNIYQVHIAIVLVTHIFSRIVFEVLLRWNEMKRNKLTISLSDRFTLDQSIKSMKALTFAKNLMFLGFVIFMIIGIVLWILKKQQGQLSMPNQIALTELAIFLPLYSIIVTILMYRKLEFIKQSKRESLQFAMEAGSESHFDFFHQQINGESEL
ncbi:unnamed protein product [Caenorhabditis angaria]|uniref:Uncharacterized protein n=1 Tax=Caenorhabditis angaria TaxID=860376 RepID=A0A9P1IXE4_9PELO|nr:unnamed protein product [Caenorhabditis angaria]